MKTSTAETRLIAALRRRIRQFYTRLNRREFDKCYEAIDPEIRKTPTSVALLQYTSSLERFLNWCGHIRIQTIEPIQIHVQEPNRLYHDRDFAIVQVTWQDVQGEAHTFKERWVRDRRGWWYTRCTGLVVPD